MDKPEQALDFVQDVVSTCGYSLGADVHIALNCSASEFYDQVRVSAVKEGGYCFLKSDLCVLKIVVLF